MYQLRGCRNIDSIEHVNRFSRKTGVMYQLRGCRNIDLQWYLGGGKLAFFSKQSENVCMYVC